MNFTDIHSLSCFDIILCCTVLYSILISHRKRPSFTLLVCRRIQARRWARWSAKSTGRRYECESYRILTLMLNSLRMSLKYMASNLQAIYLGFYVVILILLLDFAMKDKAPHTIQTACVGSRVCAACHWRGWQDRDRRTGLPREHPRRKQRRMYCIVLYCIVLCSGC